MNKSELIKNISTVSGLTQDQVAQALKGFESVVTTTLSKGEEIALVGFGTFKITDRAARTGRNPQTGAEIQIAASKVPTFKAGKSLKEAVN